MYDGIFKPAQVFFETRAVYCAETGSNEATAKHEFSVECSSPRHPHQLYRWGKGRHCRCGTHVKVESRLTEELRHFLAWLVQVMAANHDLRIWNRWQNIQGLVNSMTVCQVHYDTSALSLVLLWSVRGTPMKMYYYYSLYIFRTGHVNMNVYIAASLSPL